LDEAATFLHQSSLLDPSIVNGALALSAVPTSEIPDPPTVFLSQLQMPCLDYFYANLMPQQEIKMKNASLDSFVYFHLLEKRFEGLDVYGRFDAALSLGELVRP
jgi:hypothetical protein